MLYVNSVGVFLISLITSIAKFIFLQSSLRLGYTGHVTDKPGSTKVVSYKLKNSIGQLESSVENLEESIIWEEIPKPR
jgi:hypothetical protein